MSSEACCAPFVDCEFELFSFPDRGPRFDFERQVHHTRNLARERWFAALRFNNHEELDYDRYLCGIISALPNGGCEMLTATETSQPTNFPKAQSGERSPSSVFSDSDLWYSSGSGSPTFPEMGTVGKRRSFGRNDSGYDSVGKTSRAGSFLDVFEEATVMCNTDGMPKTAALKKSGPSRPTYFNFPTQKKSFSEPVLKSQTLPNGFIPVAPTSKETKTSKKYCVYCFNNARYAKNAEGVALQPWMYGPWRGHVLKDEAGVVHCPEMLNHRCNYCGVVGDHTERYCSARPLGLRADFGLRL